MSFTASVTEQVSIGGTITEAVNSYTDEVEHKIDKAVPDASTDFLIALTLDVSQISVVFIVSDQNVTLEFNNSTTGVPTIALLANKPYLWKKDNYWPSLLTADITAMYVTNASGSTANFKFRALYDATV